MSGGKMPKKVKEEYLKRDIELHRQRTLTKYQKKKERKPDDSRTGDGK